MQHNEIIGNIYASAHLVVSAARVLEYQQGVPPSVEQVCEMLRFTPEQGYLVCRRMKALGIIDIVEGAFGTRIYIGDHLKIEAIPKGKKESDLAKDLAAFQTSRKGIFEKVESFKTQQEEKKKSLFADLEKQLKENLEKKKR
ncbi:MAG: hypothetical protein RBT11_00620 [Desulfobacterales bacterium]|nr:hypothetical protein [Desulfobacterales bacterium]